MSENSEVSESAPDTVLDAMGRVAGISSSFGPIIEMSGTIDEAFPDVDPNYEPLGKLVLLQIRLAHGKIKNSDLVLPPEVIEAMQQNTQVAKVISLGHLAYRDNRTGQPWPEGAWVKPGDFIRVPRYGGDRWEVKWKDGVIPFLTLKDYEVSGRIPRPLDAISYI